MTKPSPLADLMTGAVALAVGISVVLSTADYEPLARHFPRWLGVVVSASGVMIMLSAFMRFRHAGGKTAVPVQPNGYWGVAAYALVLLAWSTALTLGLGYIIPSCLALAVLLIIAGEQRAARIAFGSVAIALFCFVMFYIVFKARLPETELIKDIVAPLRRLF